ncbi:F0F1 ATP synthase subunit epsilon [Aliifodinibius sp. S!AR15-10]|uniref:F0F1 ATP synthase subunit epsilon n=1 Tax=Aliifodinibius sp. S!AR15-10 TaxID=2950437 RepID=UPI002860B5F9|nr:F0F1 ATP synthase subunit epsilon [Aliifodinibius sp. S!AR15-10]MDR8390205.1 F0F1 ATP synthase subunit epsilon [Aliifodinibius sp. S!AR15-10]
MNNFEAQILTPQGSLFDDQVTGVQVPGAMGSFEIKTLHASIISTLEIGRILVRRADGEELYFAVSGGFVEVHDNKLTLLAEAAEQIAEIDVERAKEAKERAVERLESDDSSIDKERARKALERAENRIKLAANFSVSTQ